MPPEQNRAFFALVTTRMRDFPAYTYWMGLAIVVAAALGVVVMFAVLVNALTAVLAGVIVVALTVAMSGGVTRRRRLPPETLFYAGLALVPLFIILALIAIIT